MRRSLWLMIGFALAFSVGVLLHAPVCWPFDVIWNLGPTLDQPELRAPADGKVRLVVLQHGMWRTAMSLSRLERTLQHHGYEVLNTDYPSTSESLEANAARLRDAIERRFCAGPVDELSFVGHSMGGLVIEEYLRLADAREPTSVVYVATPHRGAVLADLRRHWFLFRLAMGTTGAMQLATSDSFHRQPIPFGQVAGTVVGDVGEGNGSIPGRDDGTVGVTEATFGGASATVTVPYGHTRIIVMDEVLRQVLHFLRHRTFAAGPKSG